jgi:hypothetical protein
MELRKEKFMINLRLIRVAKRSVLIFVEIY